MSVLKTFSVDIQNNGGILTTLQEIAGYILSKIGEAIQGFASDTGRMDSITKGINSVLGWIGDIFTKSPTDNAADSPLGKIVSGLTELVTKAATNLTASLVTGNPLYDAIVSAGKAVGLGIFEGMAQALTTEEARIKLENIVRGMLDKLPPGVKQFALAAFNLGTAITNKLVPIEAPTTETTGFDLSKWASGFGDAGTDAASSLYTKFDDTLLKSDWTTTFGYPTQTITDDWGLGHSSLLFEGYGEESAQSLYDGMNNLVTQTLDWSSTWSFVTLKTREVLGLDKGLSNPFYLAGQDMVWGIIAGFQSMIETLKAEWNALIMLLPEDARDKWLITSPSKLFKGMGANIVKGLALGISDSMYLARGAMSGLITTTATPSFVMNAPVSAPPVYGGNTANFNGDIHINNGLDWAMFKAQVQKAIVEG